MNSVLWLCHHLLIHVRRAVRYKPKEARCTVSFAHDNGVCHGPELREIGMEFGVVKTIGELAHENLALQSAGNQLSTRLMALWR